MQVCTSLQTDNHANTPPLSFLQAGCPSCRPTNSVKALKDQPKTELVGITGASRLNTLLLAKQQCRMELHPLATFFLIHRLTTEGKDFNYSVNIIPIIKIFARKHFT